MKPITIFSLSLILLISIACNNSGVKNYTPVEINSEWFKVTYLNPQTYIIEEPKSSQGNVSYLLFGDKKAIMFDTGCGENEAKDGLKIKPLLAKMTNLPTTLLLSHFHFDHNQNIAEFSNIAFPDLPFLRASVSDKDVYTFTDEDLFTGDYPAKVQVTEWLPMNTDIDLGNRKIQLVNIPGHTKESVAIIDKTNKLAFLGDYLYNGSLFLFDEKDIPVYKKTVNYLSDILTDDYRLFGAHGKPEIAYEELEKLNDFLICIENKICQSKATKMWGYDVIVFEYEKRRIVVFQ